MIASDLLDVQVLDDGGNRLGWAVDLRFVLDGSPSGALPRARLHGLIVSPRTRTSFLGFERSDVRHPWPLAPLLRWWHRGTFLVHWPDVARVGSGESGRSGKPGESGESDAEHAAAIVLREGFTRYAAAL